LDIEAAADYYDMKAGRDLAERFVDAVEACVAAIGEGPGLGSPSLLPDLPGLRSRPVAGFPYRIFYVERAERIEVLRVLHAHRDIPAALRPEET
jgi:toxin ParE1/3/4